MKWNPSGCCLKVRPTGFQLPSASRDSSAMRPSLRAFGLLASSLRLNGASELPALVTVSVNSTGLPPLPIDAGSCTDRPRAEPVRLIAMYWGPTETGE